MPPKKILPPFLKSGDEVAMISPSWAIDLDKINRAVVLLEKQGLKVRTGKNILKRSGPFAGQMMNAFMTFRKLQMIAASGPSSAQGEVTACSG